MKNSVTGLYVITDTTIQTNYSHTELAAKAVGGGADIIQLRDKTMPGGLLLKTAREICKICHQSHSLFIVNDRVDVALLTEADGIHLGKDDLPIEQARQILGPDKIIGGTASTLKEAKKVAYAGADYIGFGHIYPTKTKNKPYAPRGIPALKTVCSSVSIPVVAIGGIKLENINKVKDTGTSAVAICSAICKADNPEIMTSRLRKMW